MELAVRTEASGPGLLETNRVDPPDARCLDHSPHALTLLDTIRYYLFVTVAHQTSVSVFLNTFYVSLG